MPKPKHLVLGGGEDSVQRENADSLRLWVQCNKCQKWRRQPLFLRPEDFAEEAWTCEQNEFDQRHNTCEAPQEAEGELHKPPIAPSDLPESRFAKLKRVMSWKDDGATSDAAGQEVLEPMQIVTATATPTAGPRKARSKSSERPRQHSGQKSSNKPGIGMLLFCSSGIMVSFVLYGIVLEYSTSGSRHIDELSLICATSTLYAVTAYVGRKQRKETPTSVKPWKMAVISGMSLASTWLSIFALRFVQYPIRVLLKSCKPIPVMLIGACLGRQYPLSKYLTVLTVTAGVCTFMLGGMNDASAEGTSVVGVVLLGISLFADGGTGALEDLFMHEHYVGPFDLMFNVQRGKAVISALAIVLMGKEADLVHLFADWRIVLLGTTGAMGQVFIFTTISTFGALTTSIVGLTRKVTTLVASALIYGHNFTDTQYVGLVISFVGMVANVAKKNPCAKSEKEPPEGYELVATTEENPDSNEPISPVVEQESNEQSEQV